MMLHQACWIWIGCMALMEFLTLPSCTASAVNARKCGGAIKHVHIAVGPQPSTSMIVSFATIPSRISPAPVGGVRVGTSADQLNKVYLENKDDSPSFYKVPMANKRLSNDGNSDFYWSPYYHHVVITGLKSSTTYYYRPVVKIDEDEFFRAFGPHNVIQSKNMTQLHAESSLRAQRKSGKQDELDNRRLMRWKPYDGSDKDCPSATKIRYFRTAPAIGSKLEASFAIMGDLGQFPHSEETMERLLHSKHMVDAAILAGDIAYTGRDHRRWDTFFDFLDDYMAFETIPLHICPGNHDIDKQEMSAELFLAYENRFRMPRVQPPRLRLYDGPLGDLNMDQPPYPLPYEFGNAYYSWQYAGAYFIMVSAYSSMEPGSTQRRWINKELQRANRKRELFPWLIVTIHTPIFNTFAKHLKDKQIVAAKEHLEPLFVEAKVNVVFSGHIHAYQRTHPIVSGELNPQGPVHITVGASGRACEAPFREREPEEWIAVRDATMYGFGKFTIYNQSVAEWDWIQTAVADDDRDYNELVGSEERLPAGPQEDHVYIRNQYYL